MAEFHLETSIASVDSDSDGINDDVEIGNGYNPLIYTNFIYVDAAKANDSGDGKSEVSAKKSIKAAVNASKTLLENLILVKPGTYSGVDNRGISFDGYNIKIRSLGNAADTIVDLEGDGPFITLSAGENTNSWLDGFTVRNGYTASYGIAIYLNNAGMDIRNCVFENNNSGKLVRYETSPGQYQEYWQEANSTAAVYAQGWPVRVTNTIFRNNTSRENMYGGGMGGGNCGALNLINSYGSVIDHCRFVGNRGYGAGAIVMAGGQAEVTNSRFINNHSFSNGGAISGSYGYYGGGENTRPSILTMKNCLLSGNRSVIDYSDLYMYQFQTNLYNVTITDGSSRDGRSVYFEQNATVKNSIITGIVNKGNITFVAKNNCNPADWSTFGTGNITTDPMLTAMGYLKSGSPCIGTGTDEDLIVKDVDGVARVAGSVDMGCQEFIDSDSDGIPDYIETAAGLDPNAPDDAELDKDGDGLANLQEYQLGTRINLSDSDGDGIADDDELSLGYNPLVQTRFIYVDAARPDDSGDALTLATAKKTLKAAIAASQTLWENVILVKAGRYAGADNRNLNFNGYNIRLHSMDGAANTIVDLTGANSFLLLHHGEIKSESSLAGFSFVNGNGQNPVIRLDNAGLRLYDCIFPGHVGTKTETDYDPAKRFSAIGSNLAR